MRTIALVFGDNDYGNTFRPLLDSVYRAFDWNSGLSTWRFSMLAIVASPATLPLQRRWNTCVVCECCSTKKPRLTFVALMGITRVPGIWSWQLVR